MIAVCGPGGHACGMLRSAPGSFGGGPSYTDVSTTESGRSAVSADFHAIGWAQGGVIDANALPGRRLGAAMPLSQLIAADKLTNTGSRGSGLRSKCPSVSRFTPNSPTTAAGSPLAPWAVDQGFIRCLHLGRLPRRRQEAQVTAPARGGGDRRRRLPVRRHRQQRGAQGVGRGGDHPGRGHRHGGGRRRRRPGHRRPAPPARRGGGDPSGGFMFADGRNNVVRNVSAG